MERDIVQLRNAALPARGIGREQTGLAFIPTLTVRFASSEGLPDIARAFIDHRIGRRSNDHVIDAARFGSSPVRRACLSEKGER